MDDPNHEYSNLYQLAFFSWAGRIIREIYNTQFGENINLQRQMDPKFTEVSQLFERFKAPILRKDFDTSTKFLSQLKVHLNSSKFIFFFVIVEIRCMDRENKKRKEIENVLVVVEDLVRRQRQQSFLLLSLAEYFSLRRSSDDEDDTTMVTDLLWKIPEQIRRMDRLIRLTDTDCVNNLRMDRNCFGRLCLLLRERMGLKDRKFVSVEEQVSMLLSINFKAIE
ncbi:hypothetical protein SASPL_140895 [Salvia splendens]|uniref:DUF8040 domain-containing protein n=1 Tax=Salvia splendens TaxID=180675 RepID=A0A8X8WSP3_SALSN|nr:hypothetical protein SASPL_140895 [Salvia splendens]